MTVLFERAVSPASLNLYNRKNLTIGLYDTAANLSAGISRRLRGKVISLAVDDYGFSNDLLQSKTFIIKHTVRIALITE